jgi:hypothetical protein
MDAKSKSTMAHYFGLSATLCFLVLWLMTGVVLAQETMGQLQVEVFGVDSTGERYYVPGAKVVVTPELGSPDTKKTSSASRESLADANGKAVFSLPYGCYQVAATSEGLKGQGDKTCLTTSGTAVNLAIEMKLDIVMKENMEVSATQEEGLETTESSASGTVDSSTLEHAPNVNDRF